MKLLRCNGIERHYYDGDVYSECPECKKKNVIGVKETAPSPKPVTIEQTSQNTISMEQAQQMSSAGTNTIKPGSQDQQVKKYEPKQEQPGLFKKVFGKKKEKAAPFVAAQPFTQPSAPAGGMNPQPAAEPQPKPVPESLSERTWSVEMAAAVKEAQEHPEPQPIQQPVQAPLQQPAEQTPPSITSDVAAVQNTHQSNVSKAKTVAYYNFGGNEPVVGWLVCVKGSYKGMSFQLEAGQNFIGRSLGMNIVLKDDIGVSRENHAMVMFEPKKNEFYLMPGQSSGITYLNDSVLLAPAMLKQYDSIGVGSSLLLFVPFCSESINWDKFKD